MDLLERILSLLSEKSPRTTSEVAELLDLSWHSAHENLLELQLSGKVNRIFIGNRHIWFLNGDDFSNLIKTSNGNGKESAKIADFLKQDQVEVVENVN